MAEDAAPFVREVMQTTATISFTIWLVGAVACRAAGATFDWTTGPPEKEGMVLSKLEAAWSGLTERNTKAFLVVRHDKIVFERYATGYRRTTKHNTASMAKALVGGMTLMLAIEDGRIKPDDPGRKFVPQWAEDPKKAKITIRMLATHTSGIEDAEMDGQPHDQLTGWKGDFWKRLAPPRDPFTLARDIAPVLDAPGTRARYSNPGMAMLSYCVTASLRGATNADLRSLLKQRLMTPLGISDGEWSVGYGATVEVDGLPLVANWGGGAYSPNAVAHIGRLMLRKGDWQGQQLLSEAVVKAATIHAGLPNNSGLGWWVNREANGTKHWNSAPGDAFWGAGAGHQFLLVVPSLNLIVVRNGEVLDKNLSFDDALETYVVAPLMGAFSEQPRGRAIRNAVEAQPDALSPPCNGGEEAHWSLRPGIAPLLDPLPTPLSRGEEEENAPRKIRATRDNLNRYLFSPPQNAPAATHSIPETARPAIVNEARAGPYPPSPIIKDLVWAPKETILRKAKGSDNWPLTWADDDALYTAYGDGNGFEPHVREKLSLGFAKVAGSPPELFSVNIRSTNGEQKGDGKAGKKASGLLMVNGVLYLWARNADNSQLAWSTDHAQTWTWADWKFTNSLGCPTFLNFGKNYSDARDDFVYVYSHDADNAYEAADRFVLARVSKDHLKDRAAYEFFKSLGADGSPFWTKEIAQRGAVFAYSRRCYRSGISYSSALKRYLWCQTLPGGDARFSGGFGIYDAPEPWGPWTTVYFTERCDVGPGETSSFPTKWMSADGKTLYLVFSGEDSFSVRKAEIVVR